MTPSAAHETAWNRGIEHDQMTIACRNILEQQWLILNWSVSSYKEDKKPHKISGIWCEEFFVSERGPRWFADILARWTCEYEDDRKNKQTHIIYGVFEIKPKLYSAGAALRQRAVQKERLHAWAKNIDERAFDKYETFVDVIATQGDPLIQTFIDLGRTSILVWNGDQNVCRVHYPISVKVA